MLCCIEAIGVALAELLDVSLHNLCYRQVTLIAEQHEVPEKITKLLTHLVIVKHMPVKRVFFDEIDDFSCFSCKAKSTQDSTM
jgi:hypothetical protein